MEADLLRHFEGWRVGHHGPQASFFHHRWWKKEGTRRSVDDSIAIVGITEALIIGEEQEQEQEQEQ